MLKNEYACEFNDLNGPFIDDTAYAVAKIMHVPDIFVRPARYNADHNISAQGKISAQMLATTGNPWKGLVHENSTRRETQSPSIVQEEKNADAREHTRKDA